MFSIEWDGDISWDSHGRVGQIFWNQSRVCDVQTWGFHSCAVLLLQHWNGAILSADLNAFFDFVAQQDEDWQPEEAYFLLSSTQVGRIWAKQLIEHPCVKQVDKFSNKAHGPNDVFLFRWSAAKDFS